MNQALRSIQLTEGRVWIFADRDASATPGNGRTRGVHHKVQVVSVSNPGSVILISCTHCC